MAARLATAFRRGACLIAVPGQRGHGPAPGQLHRSPPRCAGPIPGLKPQPPNQPQRINARAILGRRSANRTASSPQAKPSRSASARPTACGGRDQNHAFARRPASGATAAAMVFGFPAPSGNPGQTSLGLASGDADHGKASPNHWSPGASGPATRRRAGQVQVEISA